jgi:glycosyltransferase involved in cell wall biosynthesis
VNRVAVLLTTYNGERFLGDLLGSLERQSDTRFDLLIRDDGSKDRTLEILETFQADSPLDVTILPPGENLGAAQNFAHLLDTALERPYRYFMFCDQDDLWMPHKVERTLQAMQAAEVDDPSKPLLVHTDLQVVDEHLTPIAPSYWHYQGIDPAYDTLNRLLVQNVVTGCTVVINRPLAEKATPIPKRIIMHDWWVGLVASTFGRIVALPDATVQYRQHNANDTGADAFGPGTITRKALALLSFSFDKYTTQAHTFLDRYHGELDENTRTLLEAFTAIEEEPWLKGKATLLRHHIFKQHWTRNIGLLLCR